MKFPSLAIHQLRWKECIFHRIHLSPFASIFSIKMHVLWFVDSLTINRKLLLTVFCTPALSISHKISQITFTTISWGGYYNYLQLTDEKTEGQQGLTDTNRKAGMWAKAFVHLNPRLLLTRLWGTDSPGDHRLCAPMPFVASVNITLHDDQLSLPRKLINIPQNDQWRNVGSSKDQ